MSFFSFSKTVIGSLLSKPATLMYPFKPRQFYKNTRGSIAITIESCILCGLCSKRCPTEAIVVDKPQKRWEIDRLRCCTCAACVEVCPTKCLRMENAYSAPDTTRSPYLNAFIQPPKAATAPAEAAEAK
ncbi:MAG: 4Fe-4S dicluster domain-containing protein [Chitinivibrionales bacterium]|nr:4Fe-4S dicluster domain-containing protein [Chitinivibrionales bacterium]